MKKLSIISLFLLLGFVLGSCNRDKAGYTINDIVGEYTFSNAADAFEGLEADAYTYLCDDAVITITKDGKNAVDFRLSCPNEEHNAHFNGAPFPNENDSIIRMSYDYGYDKYPPSESTVTAQVSKMDGKIRLQGHHYFYSGTSGNVYIWYFDVVKKWWRQTLQKSPDICRGIFFVYFFKVILKVVPSPTTEDLTKILPLW